MRELRRVAAPVPPDEPDAPSLSHPVGTPRFGNGVERSAGQLSALLPDPDERLRAGMPPPPRTRRPRRWQALAALLAVAILGGVSLAAFDPRGAAQLVLALSDMTRSPEPDPGLIDLVVEDQIGLRVAQLLAAGADPDTRDRTGVPALLVAARHHAPESVALLMAAGANPTALEPMGRPVLIAAAAEGLTAALAQMLDSGADIDMPSGADGCTTPLAAAAGAGQLRTVQMLLDRGAALDGPTDCAASLLALSKAHPAVLARIETAHADAIAETTRHAPEPAIVRPPLAIDPAEALREATTDPARFPDHLFVAIDGGNAVLVRALLANRPEDIRLDEVARFVSDDRSTGYRSAVDYALLRGDRDISAILMGAGLIPSVELFHIAIQRHADPAFTGVATFLLERGIDPNAAYEGMTPLMRAAHASDLALVEAMLQHGADATVQTPDGLTAADFAPPDGDPALRELLITKAKGPNYTRLMFGLSWLDRLAEVTEKVRDCRPLGERFTACDLHSDGWLPDVEAVEAHFDRTAEERLVAIQVRSRPIQDHTRDLNGSVPRERFEEVRSAIAERLPKEHLGFATRRPPAGVAFWQGLKPDVKAGEYYAYWSDEELSRPAFVYLKLTGRGEADGFYQIVIGNPFRIG